jgi:uncharacterized protein (TIRG00374 family)
LTSDNSKRNKFRKITGLIISFLLTAVFLYIAFYGVNLSGLLDTISNVSILWIMIFIVTFFFSHILRAIRWKVIIGSVKQDASILNLFGALMVGYGVNCVIPRLGEVTRAVLLGRWEKISKTSMVGTVIVERIIDILAFAIAVLISVYIYSGNLYSGFPWLEAPVYIVTVLMLILILFLFFLGRYKERLSKVFVKLVGKISLKLADKLGHIFELLLIGLGSLKGFNNLFITILLTVLILLVYAFNSYFGFFIVGMEKISPVSFKMAWIVMSISSIGVLIPTPGGTGSYHTFVKTVLVLLFGYGEEISLAYAIMTHIISYILFIISAVLFFFWLNKRYSRLETKNLNII